MSTIAKQLGQTPHVSPLLRKVRRLGLAEPEDLRRLAVKRGCSHYGQPDDNLGDVREPGREQFPDIELAFAMLSAEQSFNTRRIRTAVQLLSGVDVSPKVVIRLAHMERCEVLIRQVAEAGTRFDDERANYWREILDGLQNVGSPPEGRLPHASRYYVETGISSINGKLCRQRTWLR